MKRFILMLMMVFGVSVMSFGQIQWYKTSEISIRYLNKNTGYWTNWSDWEKCVVNVRFDLNNDVITIYSDKTQRYQVLELQDPPYDSSGKQVKFYVKDQDGDYGHIRLRIENNGNSQIYIQYADIMWCYNVRRTS